MMRAQSGIGFSGGGIGLKASGVLAQSAAPASVTGTLSETVLATIAIPAGAMGVNGSLRITTLWTFTSSADSKTVQARLGGTSIGLAVMTANSGLQHQIILRNRGAANSQIAFTNGQTSFAVTSGAMVTTAIDTSIAQNLTLTATIGANAGSNTITLEAYTVENLNP